MMQFFNSQERTIEDWKAILREADPRLGVQEVNQHVAHCGGVEEAKMGFVGNYTISPAHVKEDLRLVICLL